jgi:pimeloyl-ACP methyl ester carboxylesterase
VLSPATGLPPVAVRRTKFRIFARGGLDGELRTTHIRRTVDSSTQPQRRPSAQLLALEGRSAFELIASIAALPFLELLRSGDGHPVMVIPGWLASDRSTLPLRWFLRRRGYHVHGWQLGRNEGPSRDLSQALVARFRAIRSRHGRTVSLIGWSLGGIYARELARHFPQDVRQVITLASPFRSPNASNASRLFGTRERATSWSAERQAALSAPIPVPTTSIYSRSDGIVAWQSCLEEDGLFAQNVEVVSSHVGMGHHPFALVVIADRLAQPEGSWQPFQRGLLPRWAVGA